MTIDDSMDSCKELLQKMQAERFNKVIIEEIAKTAYSNGYNHVLDAVEAVVSRSDYLDVLSKLNELEDEKA